MLFTLFVAVLAAALWALRAFLADGSAPHDPSTLELAVMAGITVATYVWMRRLQAIRDLSAADVALETSAANPEGVPTRYASACAELEREEAVESAEHVA